MSNTLQVAGQMMEAAENEPFRKALVQARAMRMLNEQLTPALMDDVKYLQGSEIGFVTDRDRDGGYSVDQIKSPLIVAMLSGLRPTGNEFNIIAGRCYATVNGLRRVIAEWPGLTDLAITPGVPTMAANGAGALVSITATWRLDGMPMQIRCEKTDAMDTRIPVKTDKYTGTDAIIGKAKRKLYARIVERLTGSVHALPVVDEDGNPDDPPPAEIPAETIESLDPRVGSSPADEAETIDLAVAEFRESIDFRGCSTVGDCHAKADKLNTAIIKLGVDDGTALDLESEVAARCQSRIDEIKSSRGPRSNH